jgi:hypothetical protein
MKYEEYTKPFFINVQENPKKGGIKMKKNLF